MIIGATTHLITDAEGGRKACRAKEYNIPVFPRSWLLKRVEEANRDAAERAEREEAAQRAKQGVLGTGIARSKMTFGQ